MALFLMAVALCAVFHLGVTPVLHIAALIAYRALIDSNGGCETATAGTGFSQLFRITLFLAGTKVPCGRLPGLTLCMEISWLPVPTTGRLLSGRKKMALGRRHMSTQGMIPQVCGVWSWKVKLRYERIQ